MVFELKNIYKDYLQGKEAVPVLKDISLEVSEAVLTSRQREALFLTAVTLCRQRIGSFRR